jgi:hypothetical protein
VVRASPNRGEGPRCLAPVATTSHSTRRSLLYALRLLKRCKHLGSGTMLSEGLPIELSRLSFPQSDPGQGQRRWLHSATSSHLAAAASVAPTAAEQARSAEQRRVAAVRRERPGHHRTPDGGSRLFGSRPRRGRIALRWATPCASIARSQSCGKPVASGSGRLDRECKRPPGGPCRRGRLQRRPLCRRACSPTQRQRRPGGPLDSCFSAGKPDSA